MKHLKVLVKWNWRWNFTCVSPDNFSALWNLFSPNNFFICLAFRKCRKKRNILEVILVLGFVHWKLKLLDFLSDFILSFARKESASVFNFFVSFFFNYGGLQMSRQNQLRHGKIHLTLVKSFWSTRFSIPNLEKSQIPDPEKPIGDPQTTTQLSALQQKSSDELPNK